MSGTCVSGMDAVAYFESLPVPAGKEDLRERALNRIKYEAAKGIGVKKKVIKAIKSWHSDKKVCGHCGFGADEPHYHYCPNCGTAYLDNPYTEKELNKLKEKDPTMDKDSWLAILH